MSYPTVGVDITKNVAQMRRRVEPETGEAFTRSIKRAAFLEHFSNHAPCLIGIDACGCSQHWARLRIERGHQVKLGPAKFAKAFNSGNKNDAADARTIRMAASTHPSAAEGSPLRFLFSRCNRPPCPKSASRVCICNAPSFWSVLPEYGQRAKGSTQKTFSRDHCGHGLHYNRRSGLGAPFDFGHLVLGGDGSLSLELSEREGVAVVANGESRILAFDSALGALLIVTKLDGLTSVSSDVRHMAVTHRVVRAQLQNVEQEVVYCG